MDCVADLAEIGESRERVRGNGARDVDAGEVEEDEAGRSRRHCGVDGEDERPEVAERGELELPTTCSADGICAERSGCCDCLAIPNDDSVDWRVEVGEAGLRVIVEGAVVASERGGAEHVLDGTEAEGEANATQEVGVVWREAVVVPLHVRADEHGLIAAAGRVEVRHRVEAHGWEGNPHARVRLPEEDSHP
jgi:hypothetical protein